MKDIIKPFKLKKRFLKKVAGTKNSRYKTIEDIIVSRLAIDTNAAFLANSKDEKEKLHDRFSKALTRIEYGIRTDKTNLHWLGCFTSNYFTGEVDIKDLSNYSYNDKIKISIHEFNHASAHFGLCCINYGTHCVYYDGLKKLYRGANNRIFKVKGTYLNEFINEVNSYMQYYSLPNMNLCKNTANDIFYKPMEENIKNEESAFSSGYTVPYLFELGRLFLIAGENFANIDYDTIIKNGKSPITLDTKTGIPLNDLLYASKKGQAAIKLQHNFNKMVGVNEYNKLLEGFDLLFKQKNMNVPYNLDVVNNIITKITEYFEQKKDMYLCTHRWTKEDADIMSDRFYKQCNHLFSLFNIAPTTYGSRKFRSTLTKKINNNRKHKKIYKMCYYKDDSDLKFNLKVNASLLICALEEIEKKKNKYSSIIKKKNLSIK